ncbi:MAG: hypothetical protein Q9190_000536 [Brigantiaea leucoxantha]
MSSSPSSSSNLKYLLITGATGKQGRAVVASLVSSPSQPFHLLALTRNPSSPSAQSLLSLSPSHITLIKGDLDDCPAVFAAASAALPKNARIWGVYSVQVAITDGWTKEREETQGKSLIDCALAAGVSHFVYSSVDRGGSGSGSIDQKPTNVPHFESKHNIETHLLKESNNGKIMSYTILRPVAFMEGLTKDFQGKIFATFLAIGLSPAKKLQFVSVKDIGYFAAQSFLRSQGAQDQDQDQDSTYKNKAISLAGDDLSFREIDQLFKTKTGAGVPTTWHFLARILKWMLKEINIMLQWFEAEGYGASVEECRRLWPGMMSLGSWMEEESGWASEIRAGKKR